MAKDINRQWILAAYPDGMPEESTWKLVETPIPEPGPDRMLVRGLWLSVDPYMRGRISPAKNYAAGVPVGGVMQGGGVGEVVESNVAGFAPGDIVESMGFGWQEYALLGARGTRRIDPSLAPVQSALSYLGMPGLTAYFALLDTGAAKPGDTVVVSAASGAVGQVIGQIAKIKGCRAVAIASSDAKLAWCRELGYEAGINYRTAPDLTAAIAEACPDGVDIYIEHTAGPIYDAVMANLALRARIVVVGMIALAGKFGQPDIGLRHHRQILVNRARMEGFLVTDFANRYDSALKELAGWVAEGRLRYREDVLDGIENMPRAFLRLLHSENFGKQLVRLDSAA